jgi:hypothetical protein
MWIMYLVTLETVSTQSTYLLRRSVDVLHIHENCNCLCWPSLQDLFHHVFVFWEVFDIARISLTWVKWSVLWQTHGKRFEWKNLLWRWNLHFTGVASTICHLKFVTNLVLCKNSRKKLEVVRFGRAKCVRKLLYFDVFLGSRFLLVSLFSNVHN